MVKPIEQMKRKRGTRQENRVILIGTEGKNKTERLYFRGLNQKINGYVIRFASGNDTDPLKIVKSTVNSSRKSKEGLNFKKGDLAFSVFDTDTDASKQRLINAAIKYGKEHNVEVILSNPCFEVWYLQHFKYTTKQFKTSNDVVNMLHTYIPSYDKNADVFNSLWPNTRKAIDHCNDLQEYHMKFKKVRGVDRNPSSEMMNLIKYVL